MEVVRDLRKKWMSKAIELVPELGQDNYMYKRISVIEKVEEEVFRSMCRKVIRDAVAAGQKTGCGMIDDLVEAAPEGTFTSLAGRKKFVTRKFITISAKDPVDHYKFFTQMQKCIKKKMLQASCGYYAIEQRSEADQDPYGWHIHWLVDFSSTSANKTIAQQVYQCFQTFLAGSNYVDVKDVYSDAEWEAKLRYIKGEKKEDKMAKVRKDQILRKKFGYAELISY